MLAWVVVWWLARVALWVRILARLVVFWIVWVALWVTWMGWVSGLGCWWRRHAAVALYPRLVCLVVSRAAGVADAVLDLRVSAELRF